MNAIEELCAKVVCGACGGPLTKKRLNVVTLNHRAAWKYPSAGNVETGEEGRAVALICDGCVESKGEVRNALELRDGEPVYHPIESLQPMPPEQSFLIVESPHGQGIRCLICGKTSWHPEDVRNLYCVNCHHFHERVSAPEAGA